MASYDPQCSLRDSLGGPAGCHGLRPTRPAANPQAEPATTASTGGSPRPALPGQKPDGSVLLPNGWSLHPAGKQVEAGDFPVNVAVHPGGRFAAVLHAGFSEHEIRVVDLVSADIVSRTPIHEAFYGLEFWRDGQRDSFAAARETRSCMRLNSGRAP